MSQTPSSPAAPDNSASLADLRVRIDALDQRLLDLLNQRAHVAEQVGEVKKREGTPFFRPDRVAQVIEKMQGSNPGPLKSLHVAAIWREIMSACLALESPQRVAVLGPEGTFCEAAAVEYFGGAADLDARAEQMGRAIAAGDVEPMTLARYEHSRSASAADYVRGLRTVHAYGRQVAAMFERFDVLLTSTLGSAPIPIGALQGVAPGAGGLARRAFMPNTRIFNLTGQPAMSMPLAWSEEGLPIGLQFVGRMGDEATLFRLAGQLEQARPWAGRRPPGL